MAAYEQSKGIVLGSLKYGDKSRIVRIYTEQFGVLSFLVNSTSSKRSVIRSSMLLPLSLLEMEHTFKGDGKLERIKEARMDLTYTKIPYDPERNAVALFLAELFQKVLQSEESRPEKFNFVRAACLALDTLEPLPPAFHLAIWAKFTTYLGFGPTLRAGDGPFFNLHDGQFCETPPLLHRYLHEDTTSSLRTVLRWQFDEPLNLKRAEREQLLEALLSYMNIHLEGFGNFKSLEVLRHLFHG